MNEPDKQIQELGALLVWNREEVEGLRGVVGDVAKSRDGLARSNSELVAKVVRLEQLLGLSWVVPQEEPT